MKQIRCILLCAALALPFTSAAQKTQIFQDINLKYTKALELFDNKDYVNARKQFEELLKMDHRPTEPQLRLVRINAEYYRAVAAIELQNPDGELLLTQFLENHVGNAKSNMAWFYLGRHYYDKRKFNDVIKAYEQVDLYELTREQREDLTFQLAYAYFFRKDFDNAKRYFSDSKGSDRYSMPAHYYHGFISFLENDYNTALRDFQKVENNAYFGQVVPYYITSIYFQQEQYGKLLEYTVPLLEDKKMKYYSELNQLVGKAYFEQEQYEKALPYLTYYAENNRKLAKEDLFQLAYVQYQLEDYKNAINNFKQLSSINDSIGQNAMYLLADAYLKTGDKPKARIAFMEASRQNYDPFVMENALFNYGKVSYELGFHNTAINTFKQLNEQFPTSNYDRESKELLTQLFLSTRNYKDALETLESIPNKSPKMREAYQKVAFYRGVEFFNNNDLAQADQLFNKSLEHSIDANISAQAYFWKAEVDMRQQNYEDGIINYNKYLNLAGTRNFPAESSRAAANYGLGYAYFKLDRFGSALPYFERSLMELEAMNTGSANRRFRDRIYPDVVVRMADAQFMLKDYDKALANYQKVINREYPNLDYALFQKGMIHGLVSQPQDKIQTMQNLYSRYPNSHYYDDAVYQSANTYFLENNNQQAITLFNKLLNEKPKSRYVVQSLLKLSLIYFQMGNYAQAVDYAQKVTQEYPGTAESVQANSIMRETAILTNNPDYYVAKNASEQDSLYYQIAEKLYFEDNCAEAMQEFNNYLQRFDDGFFRLQVHYYRGDCLFKDKKYDQALQDYEYVTQNTTNSNYLEVSYLRAAKIQHLIKENYPRAYDYYQRLLEMSSNKNITLEALHGLVITAFETGRYNQTETYARQLINNQQASQENLIDAHYYLAKAAYANNDMETAMSQFTRTAELTDNEKGVEARYHQALIDFNRNNIKAAEATADNIIKNYSAYEYWFVKTLILVADISINKNDLLQAQATLNSIVENYEGDAAVLNEARQKLEKVNQQLEQNSRVRGEEDDIFAPDTTDPNY